MRDNRSAHHIGYHKVQVCARHGSPAGSKDQLPPGAGFVNMLSLLATLCQTATLTW